MFHSLHKYMLSTSIVLAHLLGDTLISDAAFTFQFRCLATVPPLPTKTLYFGFQSAASQSAAVVNEWTDWRDYELTDFNSAQVTKEIADGVYALTMFVSNVNTAVLTPVSCQIIKPNGNNVTLSGTLFKGNFGMFVTCADTDEPLSCGVTNPVFFTTAQYEYYRFFIPSKMPIAITPPVNFPIIGRFIGSTGTVEEWGGGCQSLRGTGYTILHMPSQGSLLPVREPCASPSGDTRFADGVYSPPGGAFGQCPADNTVEECRAYQYWGINGWAAGRATNFASGGYDVTGLRGFALADEPGFYHPDALIDTGLPTSKWNNLTRYEFEQYLRNQSLTPAMLHATTWADVTPVGRGVLTWANVTLGLRRRFYHTVRFLSQYSAKFFALATAAMERHFGEFVTTFANWNNFQGRLYTPGGLDNNPNKGSPDSASCSHDWFEYARLKGTSLVWTSDWFSDANARQWSYLAARLRSAATLADNGVEFGGYIIGRQSLGSLGLTMKIVCLAGSGAKTINIYTFGPEFLFKDNSYSDRYGTYPYMTKAFDMIGASEAVLLPGRRPVAEVAIVYPRSSFLYDPLGVQDFTNSIQDKFTMNYHLDLMGWYEAIANIYNHQCDFLDEDALLDRSVLHQYKLVIVASPNLPAAGIKALLAFASSGGSVVLSAAAAARDEYNDVTMEWDAIIGSLLPESMGSTGASIYDWGSNGEGTGAHGGWTNYGQRINVNVQAPTATQTASFTNGSPAILEAAHGAGRIVRYLFAPGYSYHYGGWVAEPGYILAALEAANVLQRVWTNVTECRKPGGVHRGVETALLESFAGAAVTVMNWCGDFVTGVDIFANLSFTPVSVSSAVFGNLEYTAEGSVTHVVGLTLQNEGTYGGVDIISFLAAPTPAPTAGPPTTSAPTNSQAPSNAPSTKTPTTSAPTHTPTLPGATYTPTSSPSAAPGDLPTPPPIAQAASVAIDSEDGAAGVIVGVTLGLLAALVLLVLVVVVVIGVIIYTVKMKQGKKQEPLHNDFFDTNATPGTRSNRPSLASEAAIQGNPVIEMTERVETRGSVAC